MAHYPLHVARTEDGDYAARLVDFADSPVGRGIDPYAAREDLAPLALKYLRAMKKKGVLPEPSAADDRPTIALQDEADEIRDSMKHQFTKMLETQNKPTMICYSWTNHLVLDES